MPAGGPRTLKVDPSGPVFLTMKRLLCLWLPLLLTALSAQETSTPPDLPRLARLRALPITLYPEVSLPRSTYPAFMNQHARPEDAIVLSYFDAFKSGARISKLGIQRGQVWIHVASDRDLTQGGLKYIEGASAILYVPAAHPLKGSKDTLMIDVGGLARSTATLKCPLIVGLEPGDARNFAKVREVAAHAAVLTIYDNQKQKGGPEAYRRYVERLVAEAKAVNPKILIEVAVSTGTSDAATTAASSLLYVCADLADRIGIYCDDTPESLTSLSRLYDMLRDDRS